VSRALDRNGLAHNDVRDLDWFGPKLPYVQYDGVVLSLSVARAQVLKVAGELYKPSSSEIVLYLAYVC